MSPLCIVELNFIRVRVLKEPALAGSLWVIKLAAPSL